MRTARKTLTCPMGKNLKMTDEVYALRRAVMQYIYEAKALLSLKGIQMPRIDVRITDNDCNEDHQKNYLGMGQLNQCTIWVSLKTFNEYKGHLQGIVYHELVHAVTGFKHDESCPLMQAFQPAKPLTQTVIQTAFLKYFKN